MNSDPAKVSPSHLHRDAYLYVRQSTLRQVFDIAKTLNGIALRLIAVASGWSEESYYRKLWI